MQTAWPAAKQTELDHLLRPHWLSLLRFGRVKDRSSERFTVSVKRFTVTHSLCGRWWASMFCFYSAACCRSDGSIRAGAKLDRRSRGSVLALQHSRCGSLRGQEGRGSGLLLNFASSNVKHRRMIMILNYFCLCCFIDDCLACVAFPRKKKMLLGV